jgi:hypothetical protein
MTTFTSPVSLRAIRALAIACVVVIAPPDACRADAPAATGLAAREANKRKAAEWHDANCRQYGANSQFLVRPGLLADRASRRITVKAESIRLSTGSPAEFALIAENSGKDYEALAVSFAIPSAVHEALSFIGVQPGRGVDPSRLCFWPKGERVNITFRYCEAEGAAPRDVPAEQLVIDTRTGTTLPSGGFAFTGSSWVTPDPASTNRAYAADAYSPNSIVSFYNESGTVLDVPRRAAQHDVYSYQVPNPDKPLPQNQLIEVLFEPEHRDGGSRVCELELAVQPASPALASNGPCYVLREGGKPCNTNTTVAGLRAALRALKDGQRDVFVTFAPADSLTLSGVRQAANLLDALEKTADARVEPPPAEHPYYKSFLPDEKHRAREGRPIQPWELYVEERAGGVTGQLVYIEEEWKADVPKPIYHETRTAISSPADLNPLLEKQDAPSVLLAFAPAEMRYGTLRKLLKPAIERKMILYVFPPPPAGAADDVSARPIPDKK